MTTDGFQDQFGGLKNKKFKIKVLRDLVLSKSHLSPKEIVEELKLALEKWQGDFDQIDDVCLFIAEV